MNEPLRLAVSPGTLLRGICALSFCLSFNAPGAAQVRFTALLSGGQEVPSTVSAATGAVTVELNGNQITVAGSFEGLMADFTGAHIHTGLAGQNGPVTVPLQRQGQGLRGDSLIIAAGTATLTAEQVAALNERRMYVNVHSQEYPSGEIRGQLVPEAATQMHAVLSGVQEVPANVSTAMGAVMVELYANDSLIVTGAFRGLSSAYTMSHLHTGLAGEVGPPVVTLTAVTGNDGLSGEWRLQQANRVLLTEAHATMLEARRMYANVHSATLGAGEIRGQVRAADTVPFTAVLNAMNEVPVNNSTATGALLAELTPDKKLVVSGSYRGMRGTYTDSHLHGGLAGQAGGVLVHLVDPVETNAEARAFAFEMQTLDLATFTGMSVDDAVANLQGRRIYPNVHSSFRPGGEIRGQLVPSSSVQFRANLSGRAEASPNVSTGHGSTLVEYLNETTPKLVVSGLVRDLSSELHPVQNTPAHIHSARLGQNGGIVIALIPPALAGPVPTQAASFDARMNTFPLTAEMSAVRDSLFAHKLYVNVHSRNFMGGEVRGQIVGIADYVYEANLSGVNEVPTVTTPATGAAIGVLHDDTLAVAGSFRNLKATLPANAGGRAHIHNAEVGVSGGVVIPLVVAADENLLGGRLLVASNTSAPEEAVLHDLMAGDHYLNIHSMAHTGGEIRGQLWASPNRPPAEPALTAPEEGAVIRLDGSGSAAVTVEWSPVTDPNGNPVHYVWQAAADSSFAMVVAQMNAGTAATLSVPHSGIIAALTAAGIDPNATTTIHHRVVATDGSMLTASAGRTVSAGTRTSSETLDLPKAFTVRGSFPNPARANAAVTFDLPSSGTVRVSVVDVLGRQVLVSTDEAVEAGFNRRINLNTGALPSGVYFYRLTAETATGTKVQSGRLVVVR